jgi:hypothetical protein
LTTLTARTKLSAVKSSQLGTRRHEKKKKRKGNLDLREERSNQNSQRWLVCGSTHRWSISNQIWCARIRE